MTHNPSDRLGWYLADAVTTHRPNYLQAQINMKQVCTQCHTQARIDRVYAQGEEVINSTNAKVLAAKNIMYGLHKDGTLTARPSHTPSTSLISISGTTTAVPASMAHSWAAPTSSNGTAIMNCSQRPSNSSIRPMNCGESMRISKLLSRAQGMITEPRLRWAHDPQLWVELFVTANLAILAADIYLAHSVNHFQKGAEYIPLYFSIGAPMVLGILIALRWICGFNRRGATSAT